MTRPHQPSQPCECANWCDSDISARALTGHHERCNNAPEKLDCALALMRRLVEGIGQFSADCDGVPDYLWDAYLQARATLGMSLPKLSNE